MRLKDIPRSRKTQPETICFGSKIRFEDPRDILLRYAAAIVIDKDTLMLRRLFADGNGDHTGLRRHRLYRIDEDIEKSDL